VWKSRVESPGDLFDFTRKELTMKNSSPDRSKINSIHELYGGADLIANVLYWFTSMILLGLFLGIFIVLSNKNNFPAIVLAVSIPAVTATYYFIWREKFELAAVFLSFILITLNTLLSTYGLGTHNISNLAYPVILVIVSLISKKQTMVLLTLYTIACVAWLVFGELSGAYVPHVFVRSVPGDFFTMTVIIVITAMVVNRLSGKLMENFQALQKESNERRMIEEDLRQREAILEAVTFAAEQFLKVPAWRSNIDLVLVWLGKTLNVTHAYLFEDHLSPEGDLLTSMRYEWTAPGYKSDLGDEYFQNSRVDKNGFEEQVAALQRGDVRIGNSSTFNPIERDDMASLGVKSILEVPVFVNGREWGAVGFDDFEQERAWSNAEVDALKIAAGILGAAIQRDIADSSLQESERIYRRAIEAAGAIPYYRDYVTHRYVFMGEGVAEITGYSAAEITPDIWNQLLQEGFPRGSMAHLTYEEADRLTEAGILHHWECDYRMINRHGQERWVSDACIQILDDRGVRIGVIGILQDVTDRKLTEANLRKRESILEAITFAAEKFLKSPDWRADINVALERLGNSLVATHTYLFEHHLDEDGLEISSLRFEWTAPGFKSDLNNPLFQNSHPIREGVDSTDDMLRRGEVFVGNTSTFPDIEKERLAELGVKAMVEIPIFVNGSWWGTIGVDDMVNERDWSSAEIDALRIATEILSAAVQRQMDEDALKRELAERKRAQQALKLSEEKFSKAFHTTPVLMTIEDADRRLIEVNNAFLETLGYEREEVIGHRASEFNLIPGAEDRSMANQLLEEKGAFKDLELRIRRRSGEIATVLMSIEDIDMNDSLYVLTSALDITDRKRAEQKYRDIFNNSMEGIFQSTEDGRFLNVNPAMARIYGYDSPKEMLESINEIETQIYVYPEQRNIVRQRLASGERLIRYESLDYRKDGSTFWASMSAQAIFDENGSVLYYEGNLEDITPRKKAEAEREALIRELAQKNAEAETLRETTSIVTSTLDVTESVQRILEQLKRVVPYDSASVWLYEGNIAHLVGVDGLAGVVDVGMLFVSDETEPDHRFLTDDVTYILLDDVREQYPQFSNPPTDYIRGWLSVALRARGRLIGFISLDSIRPGRFTEGDAQLALNFANQAAVALEHARLFSDLQKELEERKKLIEELAKKNAELEQFTYTVSHDLKSPLVTINGFLGYLEQDAISGNMERLKKDTHRIQEAVLKMQRLLNELLELSRIGRMINTAETIPFDDLVNEAMAIVHGRLQERGVQVHVQPDISIVYGDRPRLVEVMQNLIDNAAKYMGKRENPRIVIGQRAMENGMAVVFVSDNGMGIPPEHHERIFGLFNKLDARSEGTGVGLALVKRIIEVHGGRIWVESEPGMGATFLFTLPTKPRQDSVI
jgi:PAS domain S-box-containing protein